MLSSLILDTAIAIVFVFLLVSLIVTTLNEALAAMFVSRAKWLRVGMNCLLTPDFAERFYGHALIQAFPVAPALFDVFLARSSARDRRMYRQEPLRSPCSTSSPATTRVSPARGRRCRTCSIELLPMRRESRLSWTTSSSWPTRRMPPPQSVHASQRTCASSRTRFRDQRWRPWS